ncbi:MAG: hypothetical protein IMF15_06875 [Proteobacteria bacterium]|nr:hypothetical protein [Pseudomonadota bacterium]
MAVVFDEVIASVEAPATESQQEQAVGESPSREDETEKIISLVETKQRWARRLLAE